MLTPVVKAPVMFVSSPAAVIPQALTCARIVLGAAAVIAVTDARPDTAATCITIGAVLDGLDGAVARYLNVTSPFGALLDYFADYLCFIVAPWMLTRVILPLESSVVLELSLGTPLVASALRYARNGLAVSALSEPDDLPGLGTVFYTFIPVTAVFLGAPHSLSPSLAVGITATIVALSVMMLAPIPYPKLTRFRNAAPLVLMALAVMPFAWTRVLAALTVTIGFAYAVLAPFAARAARSRAPS